MSSVSSSVCSAEEVDLGSCVSESREEEDEEEDGKCETPRCQI